MRVIFLDFDGVLNSEASLRMEIRKKAKEKNDVRINETLCHLSCSNFQFILESVSDVKVVIISTWRLLFPIDWLKNRLSFYGIDSSRVIGVTPSVVSGYRGQEIKQWLDAHPDVTDFVIVDDASDMEPYTDNLVQTSWKTGLLLPQAEEVITRFNVVNHP